MEKHIKETICVTQLVLVKYTMYNIPCYLFENTSNFSHKGFLDWKHPNKINYHENSTMHKTCTFKMKHRSSDFGRVDLQLTYKLQMETDY